MGPFNFFGLTVGGVKPSDVPLGNPENEQGKSGTASFGGFITTDEVNPRLIGQNRYITAADILNNFSMVVAGFTGFQTLVSSAKWSCEPAKDINGGKDSSDEAKKMADYGYSLMDDMDTSWQRIIRQAVMFKWHGFEILEWTAKRRMDGRIGIKSIEMRPCHTIYRWLLDANSHPVGVIQMVPNAMREIPISRQKFIHMCNDGMTDSPEGVGMWRQLAEPWERMKEYLRLEGEGYARDFRGLPFVKAPLAQMDAAIAAGKMTEAQKSQSIKGILDFAQMKSKGTTSAVCADSSAYEGLTADGSKVSTVPMWDVKLLTAGATSLSDIGNAIERIRYDASMILGMEHLLLGATASGSRALSNDKTASLAMNVNSCSSDIASTFTHDMLGAMWMLNGFDPRLMPKYKVEDASFKDITVISQALVNMALAGAPINPKDKCVNEVRDLMGLSHEVDGAMRAMEMGTGTLPGNPKQSGL